MRSKSQLLEERGRLLLFINVGISEDAEADTAKLEAIEAELAVIEREEQTKREAEESARQCLLEREGAIANRPARRSMVASGALRVAGGRVIERRFEHTGLDVRVGKLRFSDGEADALTRVFGDATGGGR